MGVQGHLKKTTKDNGKALKRTIAAHTRKTCILQRPQLSQEIAKTGGRPHWGD